MTPDPTPSSRKAPARAYLQTAAQLRTVISQLQIDPGGRLPSERELAQRMGVSRPTLREALIVLELQDEIEIRIGSGIYIKDAAACGDAPVPADAIGRDSKVVTAAYTSTENAMPGHADIIRSNEAPVVDAHTCAVDAGITRQTALILHSLAEDSPKEVNQMRYFLESAVAADAARFMTASLRKKLRKSLSDMQAAMNADDASTDACMANADRQFHMLLAQSTDNQLIVQTCTSLFDQRYQPIARTMHRHFDNRQAWLAAMHEHEQICQAIENRDPLQAQAAMQRHLTLAHQRLMAMIG